MSSRIDHKNRVILLMGLIFLVLGLDQATKVLAKKYLATLGTFNYLGDLVRIQYVENPGAFLSLGAQLSPEIRFWLFTVLVAAFLVGAGFTLFSKRVSFYHAIGLSLMVGGGAGNLIDRAAFGKVIDFMNLGIGSLRTGVFNVADVAIMAGVIFIIFDLFKK